MKVVPRGSLVLLNIVFDVENDEGLLFFLSMKRQINQLWGSGFEKKTKTSVIDFTAGRDVFGVPPADIVLLPYDVWVNQAHCTMLAETKIIPRADASALLAGLKEIEGMVKQGAFPIDTHKEDVHTAIESWLTAKLGIEKAGKLHTARSRNDQSTTDVRMYLRDQVYAFVQEGVPLCLMLVKLAKKYAPYVMPGFTHHQHAMVTTFGHVLLGWAVMLARDMARFTQWHTLHNRCPLGGAASYGTSIGVDRHLSARLLGFDGPDLSSFDGLTNRWEAEADFASAIAICMDHCSQIAQTLMVFSTPEFGMVKLSDEYSTGSSMMPQKKNPDPLEVIKAKASIAAGSLQSLLGMGKANFIGYNRDGQLGKFITMELVEETLPSLAILAGALATMHVDQTRMRRWCSEGFIGATSLAERLVSSYAIPFRLAKIVVEKAVKYSKGAGAVTYPALKRALKEQDLRVHISNTQARLWQSPEEIVRTTHSFGGPGRERIDETALSVRRQVREIARWAHERYTQRTQAVYELQDYIIRITKPTS